MGKNILAQEGAGHPGILIEPLEAMYHSVKVPEDVTNESIQEYLKDVAWTAMSEIKLGNSEKTKDLFITLENSFTRGNSVTQNLALNLLDSIQTLYINLDLSESMIEPYIFPRTLIWWNENSRVWDTAGKWAEENFKADSKRTELLDTIKGYFDGY